MERGEHDILIPRGRSKHMDERSSGLLYFPNLTLERRHA